MTNLKSFLIISIFLLAGISMTSCGGKKKLEKGEYSTAVFKSVKKLRKSPDNKNATSTLKQAYPLAISLIQENINIAKSSNNQFKWNTVVQQMSLANSLASDIAQCPAARRIITSPLRFDNELPAAKKNAAEECYSSGNKELEKGNRNSAKQAYFHFIKANELVTNYKNVDSLIPEAKWEATLKVVLEQIPVGAGRLEVSAQFFQSNVEAYINDLFQKKTFVRLFLPKEAEAIELVPDQIIRIQFDDFVIGNSHTREKHTNLISKDSVKVATHTEKDGSKVDVFNHVTAKLHEYKKEVVSKGLVDVKIIEFGSNKILYQEKIPGEFLWGCEWARYNGDERALTKQQIAMCNQTERYPPAPQDLFVEFTKPIYDQLTAKLNTFYSKY